MKPKNPTLPEPNLSVCAYVTAGSLPAWEQVSPQRQQELVQALAALLLHLPELQPLLEREAVGNEPE
jgi:hypothetical protein